MAIQATDLALLRDATDRYFGGEPVVSPSGLFYLDRLDGIKAVRHDETLGFACYERVADACEIVVLVSLTRSKGIGSALVAAMQRKAKEHGCRRIRVFTTNDNLDARRFYEKRGFRIAAMHRDAMAKVRRYKPQLPTIGANGIPLRDMIELEMALEPADE